MFIKIYGVYGSETISNDKIEKVILFSTKKKTSAKKKSFLLLYYRV